MARGEGGKRGWDRFPTLTVFLLKASLRLPNVVDDKCPICNTTDTKIHALAECSQSKPIFDWLLSKLQKLTLDLTAEKVLLLDFSLRQPLPHNELPLVWLTSHTLMKLWNFRQEKKRYHLYQVRADIKAKICLLRKSKFSDMAETLNSLMTS